MARRDGTGPQGLGAMTGRGMGVCSGNNNEFLGYGMGMRNGRGCRKSFGLGFGLGLGQGIGNVSNNSNTGKTKKEVLEEQKKILENRIEFLNKQLETAE